MKQIANNTLVDESVRINKNCSLFFIGLKKKKKIGERKL
jgi:hypothetical protein